MWRDHGMWLCFSLARQCWSPSFTKWGLSFLIDKTETEYISASPILQNHCKKQEVSKTKEDLRISLSDSARPPPPPRPQDVR